MPTVARRPRSSELRFAVDKSARSYDSNGFLHVAVTNISKANVCPYFGYEIPAEGLDPDRVYHLLRAPEELEKAAASSNNIPLLDEHIVVDPDDVPKENVVGSTGTDGQFVAPYLQNSLVVHDSAAIQGIEARDKVELSCAYKWRLDLTPGTYEGVEYDGVMRDLAFNHVALVDEGRAGPDVLVADSIPKEGPMKTKKNKPQAADAKARAVAYGLHGFLSARLASDKAPSLKEVFALTAKVTADRLPKQKDALIGVIKQKYGLAKDADLDDLQELVEELQNEDPGDEPDEDEIGEDADPMESLMQLLETRLTPEEYQQASELLGKIAPPADAKPPKKEGDAIVGKKPEAPPAAAPAADDVEEGMDKRALDQAFRNARQEGAKIALDRMRAIREAEHECAPIIGQLAQLPESADDVYKFACDAMGLSIEGVPASAYKFMVRAAKNGTRDPQLTGDSAASTGSSLADLDKVVPGSSRLAKSRA